MSLLDVLLCPTSGGSATAERDFDGCQAAGATLEYPLTTHDIHEPYSDAVGCGRGTPPHLARKSLKLQSVAPLGSSTAAAGSALYAALLLNLLVLRSSTSICGLPGDTVTGSTGLGSWVQPQFKLTKFINHQMPMPNTPGSEMPGISNDRLVWRPQ